MYRKLRKVNKFHLIHGEFSRPLISLIWKFPVVRMEKMRGFFLSETVLLQEILKPAGATTFLQAKGTQADGYLTLLHSEWPKTS